MRAIRISQTGGPDVLHLEDIPRPQPGEGEVLVKIEAAGLNFVDIYQRAGLYKMSLPFTLGQEGAGTVEAVGPQVTDVRPGDRVAYTNVLGAFAEYAVVPAKRLVPVPPTLDLRIAAAVMLQGMTAHYLATSTFPLQQGQTALVHAAAGGVGQLLVQIARQRGAHVIGTAGTAEKAQLARSLGAEQVILYDQEDFAAAVRRLTDGQGVDVVYDSVGKATFDKSLDCLHPRGYLVLFGQSSGPVPPVDLQVLNAKGSLFVTRPTLANYVAERHELLARTNDLFTWIAEDQLQVRIDRTFPLSQLAQAQEYMAGRHTQGKVLLVPEL